MEPGASGFGAWKCSSAAAHSEPALLGGRATWRSYLGVRRSPSPPRCVIHVTFSYRAVAPGEIRRSEDATNRAICLKGEAVRSRQVAVSLIVTFATLSRARLFPRRSEPQADDLMGVEFVRYVAVVASLS